jgi:NTE family protein
MASAGAVPGTGRRRRVGLALGGGGVRGWAHIGVLRVLRELGVTVDCVAGTSAGAIVGAAWAAGRLDLLEDVVRRFDWKLAARLFTEVGLPRSGLLKGERLQRFLDDLIGVGQIADLPLPFAAVAVDLLSCEEVVLRSGRVAEAIRASISLPGIFTPVCREGRYLVDGGLVNPLPVSVARALGADVVIAVDLNLRPGRGVRRPAAPSAATAGDVPQAAPKALEHLLGRLPKLKQPAETARRRRQAGNRAAPSIFDVLAMSTRLIENLITRTRLIEEPPEILVQPAVGDIFTLDFQQAAPVIAAGEAAAREHEAELRALGGGRRPPPEKRDDGA